LPFDDNDIRTIIARADTLQRMSAASVDDVEALVRAGEEVGIGRAAIERAIREHLGTPAAPPAVGELTFAKSSDGKYYVGEVTAASGSELTVRFLRGGERAVALDEVRPCSFLPGDRVVCNWPNWGAWTCSVASYDASSRQVKVTDGWGGFQTFPLAEVWLAPRTAESDERSRTYAKLFGAGAAIGAVIGSLITAFVF
jgi:hypothetical protein